MKKIRLPVLYILLFGIFGLVHGADYISVHTLCKTGEQVLFSCRIQGGSAKLLSICGSANLGSKQGYLKYRFGKKGIIELEHPKGSKTTQQGFRYRFTLSEDPAKQASSAILSFKRGSYVYEVFDSVFDTDSFAKGVRVTTPDRVITLECARPVIGNLDKVGVVVPHGKP